MVDSMPPEISRPVNIPNRPEQPTANENNLPSIPPLKPKGIHRRKLIGNAFKLAFLVTAASVIGPGSDRKPSVSDIIPETPILPNIKEFDNPTFSDIQEYLNSSRGDVEIQIKGSVRPGNLHQESIPKPAREDVPPGNTTEEVALAIKGTESHHRRVVLRGIGETPVDFDINGAGYGVFCENADVTIENFSFHGGKSHKSGDPQHLGAENAYIYGSDSSVNVYKTIINGVEDGLTETPIISEKGIKGTQPTGLTGIYLRNCTDSNIIEANLINTSWDAITCNGSDVSISHCEISGLKDGVLAGAGVGITSEMVLTEEENFPGRQANYEARRHGKVSVEHTIITGRDKGIVTFDDNDVSVDHCEITCKDSAEAINSYGIWLGNVGRQSVTNSTINGKSGLIEVDAWSDNFLVQGNTFNYTATNDMGWFPESRFYGRAIILRAPSSLLNWTRFKNNTITYHRNFIPIYNLGIDALMSPNPAVSNEQWQIFWGKDNKLIDLDQKK